MFEGCYVVGLQVLGSIGHTGGEHGFHEGHVSAKVKKMDAKALRAFAARDWQLLEAGKREHWAAELRVHGAAALFRAAQMLREHARRTCPDWPTADDRAEDLAHHVRMKQLLDRAAYACSGR